MKGIIVAIGVVAILYAWDQHFEHGRYTDAFKEIALEMRRSFGV
ncbi:hypothetical protein [Bradyrhizobium genosp. P]